MLGARIAQSDENSDYSLGWFHSWKVQDIIFFFQVSVLILGPTQPPIRMTVTAPYPKVGWPRHEADHSTPYSAKINKVWNYTSILLHLHGVVLN